MEYRKKKEQIMKKYKYALYAISVANDVDLETAFKMLQSNMSRGGDYAYIKEEEFNKDIEELLSLMSGDV